MMENTYIVCYIVILYNLCMFFFIILISLNVEGVCRSLIKFNFLFVLVYMCVYFLTLHTFSLEYNILINKTAINIPTILRAYLGKIT